MRFEMRSCGDKWITSMVCSIIRRLLCLVLITGPVALSARSSDLIRTLDQSLSALTGPAGSVHSSSRSDLI